MVEHKSSTSLRKYNKKYMCWNNKSSTTLKNNNNKNMNVCWYSSSIGGSYIVVVFDGCVEFSVVIGVAVIVLAEFYCAIILSYIMLCKRYW